MNMNVNKRCKTFGYSEFPTNFRSCHYIKKAIVTIMVSANNIRCTQVGTHKERYILTFIHRIISTICGIQRYHFHISRSFVRKYIYISKIVITRSQSNRSIFVETICYGCISFKKSSKKEYRSSTRSTPIDTAFHICLSAENTMLDCFLLRRHNN